jgi:hypothetical protein
MHAARRQREHTHCDSEHWRRKETERAHISTSARRLGNMHTARRLGRRKEEGDREGRELGERSHEKGYKGERELVEGTGQKRELEGRVRKETQLTEGTERESLRERRHSTMVSC